jgi:hypothetical protein
MDMAVPVLVDEDILVVMNPPVGQLVADVPNKKPAEC